MASGSVERMLAKVLRQVPASIREIGRAAKVPHVTLIRARDRKDRLSHAAAQRVVRTLRRWGKLCNKLADELEAADRARHGRGSR